MNNAPAINLVRGRKPHIFDKVLSWALSIGRMVVILTEAVALAAFAYRFVLDRDIIDLHQKIKQEQNIVKFWQTNEAQYRNLQKRLDISSQIITSNQKTFQIFSDITSLIPPDMIVRNVSFTPDTLKLDGTISSIVSLSEFINKVKAYPEVTAVSLDKIENKTTSGTIVIGISIALKKPLLII